MLIKGKTLEEIQAECVFPRAIPSNISPLMVRVCSPEGQYDEGPGAAFVAHT